MLHRHPWPTPPSPDPAAFARCALSLPVLVVIAIGVGWGVMGVAAGPKAFSASVAPADLSAVLSQDAPIEMEENDRVINVSPQVSVDPRGGFLVAAPREAQVRSYRPDDDLARVIGRKGNGLGEFRHRLRVRRDGRRGGAG